MHADRVEIWWLDIDTVAPWQWPGLSALLDDTERQRAQRFHFDRDRLVYIAAHALGRRLLSSWAGNAPDEWRFAVGEHGKPELIRPPGLPDLRLNLSHTRGLAAAALCLGHPIGIDVEWLGRNPDCAALAQRFFAAAECQVVQDAPEAAKLENFLAFWTLKEAYVKAIGKGLAQPLDSFAFTLRPLGISFAEAGADDPALWLFRRFCPSERHLAALAVRHPHPEQVMVVARTMRADDLAD